MFIELVLCFVLLVVIGVVIGQQFKLMRIEDNQTLIIDWLIKDSQSRKHAKFSLDPDGRLRINSNTMGPSNEH